MLEHLSIHSLYCLSSVNCFCSKIDPLRKYASLCHLSDPYQWLTDQRDTEPGIHGASFARICFTLCGSLDDLFPLSHDRICSFFRRLWPVVDKTTITAPAAINPVSPKSEKKKNHCDPRQAEDTNGLQSLVHSGIEGEARSLSLTVTCQGDGHSCLNPPPHPPTV
mgnify:CR=1 FL=1